MATRILVPLDGSARAEAALPLAARLARASGGTLVLTQVLSAPGELLPFFLPGIEPSTYAADLQAATNYLTALTALPDLTGLPVETEVRSGLAASSLLRAAEEQRADLILLSSHGHSGLTHWGLGSVSERVAAQAKVPVLVAPLGEAPPAEGAVADITPGAPAMVRVLVPLDGSPAAEAALLPAARLIAQLAPPAEGLLHLTHIVSPDLARGPSGEPLADPDITSNAALPRLEPQRAYLRGVAERLRGGEAGRLGVRITWSLTARSDVARGILDLTERGEPEGGSGAPGGSQLIALATTGAGGTAPGALGSIAHRVLRGARVAVLAVPPLAPR